jgi:TRAP-type C4-dicarboxylate transport system substrate-binding protein
MRTSWKLFIWFLVAFMLAQTSVSAGEYTMLMTNEVSSTHWKTDLMEEFAEMIESRSRGRIHVKVFSGGQLFTDKSAIMALGTGAVHMVWPVSVHVEALRQSYGVVNLPFALSDELILEEKGFKEDLLDVLSKTMTQKVIGVMGLLRADELVFVFKDHRPKTVNDMKDMKIRVIGGHVFLDWLGELGVTPISMPASEFTTALSQGLIDGIHTSSDGWAKMLGRLGQFGLLVPDLSIAVYSILIDNKWLAALPEDLKTVISQCVEEISMRQWRFSMKKTQEAFQKIRNEFGADIFTVAENEIPQWVVKTSPSYGRFSRKYPEIFKKFVRLHEMHGRTWPPEF